MKHLFLKLDYREYAVKAKESFSPYGFTMSVAPIFFDCITIDSQEVADITVFDNINTTTQSLVAGDKVFIMPGVTIPRYKIRETGKEIGFDIVRNASKATKIVYNKTQVMDEMVDRRSMMGIEIEDLKKILNMYSVTIPELDATDIESKIILEWSTFRVLNQIQGGSLDNYHFYTYVYKQDTYKTLLDNIITNNIVVISDKDVVKQCNGSQPLNAESYTRLVSMLESRQNQEIAIELICNCDYDQSMLYILRLLGKFNFHHLPGTNHVNYKAFRNYVKSHWDIDPNYFNGDIIDVLRKVAEQGKLKREYLNEFKDDILKHVRTYGENSMFAISGIQLRDDFKTKLVE